MLVLSHLGLNFFVGLYPDSERNHFFTIIVEITLSILILYGEDQEVTFSQKIR
jgi:hypothetical protein